MKVDDVYINKYNGYHVVICRIDYKWETVSYKYIQKRDTFDKLSFFRTFLAHYKFSEKFTKEYMIKKIIQ